MTTETLPFNMEIRTQGEIRRLICHDAEPASAVLRVSGIKILWGRYTTTQLEQANAYVTGLRAGVTGNDTSELATRQSPGGITDREVLVATYNLGRSHYLAADANKAA